MEPVIVTPMPNSQEGRTSTSKTDEIIDQRWETEVNGKVGKTLENFSSVKSSSSETNSPLIIEVEVVTGINNLPRKDTFWFTSINPKYTASQKHESTLLHKYVLNKFLTADHSCTTKYFWKKSDRSL